jgi:phytoene dehydrogenase-like protein
MRNGTVNMDWDAVVIGAGIGGLVCAGYLAASGLSVLVLEQHDVAGGNGHVFRRRRAYEFDVGVHYLGDCGPGGILPAILAGLGLRDRVNFLPMDQDGFDRIMLPGLTLDVPTGWERYRDRLMRAMPEDAAGIARCVDICAAIGEYSHRSLRGEGDQLADFQRQSHLLRWGRRSLTRLFDDCGLSAKARTVLAAQSGNYGSAPADTRVSVHAAMLDHYMRGAYYPEGGGQVLTASLVEALEAHGGELRTRCEAKRVMIDRGRVTGVQLADGSLISTPLVVSNADYRRTILDLCGAERNFDRKLVDRTRTATMRLSFSVAYVVLDTELADRPNANVWWYGTEDIEKAYAQLLAGQADPVPFVFLSFASLKDPKDGCPPGHTNLQIMTLSPPGREPWGLSGDTGLPYRRDPRYQEAKRALTERLLDAAEAAIGPFRDHIVYLETATPLTNERYTLTSGGSPYGMADLRPDSATSVTGLHVVGKDTRYGSGIAGVAIGGISCAAQIIGSPLLPRAFAGDALNDAALPARGYGSWDPLEVSRGVGRRGAKGLARLDTRPTR